MPSSGAFFADFAAQMATDRDVYCPDLPGYGGSYRPESRLNIQGFAQQLGAAIEQLPDVANGIDLLGFHTGCFVAAELAISKQAFVSRMVLPGIPYFSKSMCEELKAKHAQPPDYLDTPQALGELWKSRQTHVEAGAPRQRVFQILVEELRGAPNGWWGFAAAFEYPAEQRLPLVPTPVLAIADKGLFEPTCSAAVLIPEAKVIERPDLGAPLFVLHAAAMAATTRSFLV